MSKKIGGVVVLAATCALSFFVLSCGSSSSRPFGVLYVLTQGSSGEGNSVSSFAMDLNSGNLSLLNTTDSNCPAASASTCGAPLEIQLDPPGATAYVLNQGMSSSPNISSFAVNSDGSLAAPTAAATLTGASPVAMTLDAAGQFLFVIDRGASPAPTTCPLVGAAAVAYAGCPSISVYSVMSGSLTFVSQSSSEQSSFYLSKSPSALSTITFTPQSSAAEELLFVTNNYDLCTVACVPASTPEDNTVSVYVVDSSGVLHEQPGSPYSIAANDPVSVMAVNTNPSGGNAGGVFVYVGNTDQNGGDLNPFLLCTALGVGGCTTQQIADNVLLPLTQACAQPPCPVVSPYAVGKNPAQMVVDPTNNFLYSVSSGSNQVFGFKINTTAGTLTALSPANQPTGSNPVSIALHPSVNNTGQFLYTSNNGSSSISGFTLSTTDGSMGNPISVAAPAAPSGIAVH